VSFFFLAICRLFLYICTYIPPNHIFQESNGQRGKWKESGGNREGHLKYTMQTPS
jgi:hypothetical protein